MLPEQTAETTLSSETIAFFSIERDRSTRHQQPYKDDLKNHIRTLKKIIRIETL